MSVRVGLWAGLLAVAAALPAQAPAPGGVVPAGYWLTEGERLLEREDPVRAWLAYQLAIADGSPQPPCHVGLGRSHLMLGRSAFAHRHAEAALAATPADQDGMALAIRALIRARAFDAAVLRGSQFLLQVQAPGAELLAARASAMFRVQRIDEAAQTYRRVVGLDPFHAEAHLRLGSGLLPPMVVTIGRALRQAVAAARAGRHRQAITLLLEVAAAEPGNPVAHRLLGEALYAEQLQHSMAATDPAFAALAATLPVPDVRRLPIAEFMAGYEQLSPQRRLVVDRVMHLFGNYLPTLISNGSRHDLLLELERTTDAKERRRWRGVRTFDGRVWDDVRGIGGMRAATGIEALDEAATFGFDTLAHEIAHQVHFYALSPMQKGRIKSLYRQALTEGRCIDYYAASNDAEYFGQGVEAFVSLAKRPGGETTHGHTRFELYRTDPDLHDFCKSVVAHDPLSDKVHRDDILAAAARAALRCGRASDALLAAEWMGPDERRRELLAEARRALAAATCH